MDFFKQNVIDAYQILLRNQDLKYLNFFLYTFAKAFLIEGLTLLLKAKDARILCVYETCSTE